MMDTWVVNWAGAALLGVALGGCNFIPSDDVPGSCGGLEVAGASVVAACGPSRLGVDVTGLRGSGLVVHDSASGRDKAIATNGKTEVGLGARTTPYALAIAAQPVSPWQTCTLGPNASGTLGDWVTVALTCTTNRYAVGGTVTGVAAGGVSLQLGSEAVHLDAEGVFTFATPVESGAPWRVTATVDPTQLCTVAGGSGTMAGADVRSVQVACDCVPPLARAGGACTGG